MPDAVSQAPAERTCAERAADPPSFDRTNVARKPRTVTRRANCVDRRLGHHRSAGIARIVPAVTAVFPAITSALSRRNTVKPTSDVPPETMEIAVQNTEHVAERANESACFMRRNWRGLQDVGQEDRSNGNHADCAAR